MPPIETIYLVGSNLYVIIHAPNGTVWNDNSQAFESYNASNWADYAVHLVEQAGSGYYLGTYPAAIAGVLTTEVLYERVGGAPAISDAPPKGMMQSQGADVGAIAGDQPAAQNLSAAAASEVRGKAVTGTLSTSQATTDLTQALNDAYAGRTVIFTSGALKGIAAGITAYGASNGLLSFTTLPVAPSNGDTFIIV